MKKIFRSKKQFTIFAAIIGLFIFALAGWYTTRELETEWYDNAYNEYMKAPENYTVTETTIKELKTYNGKNDETLTYIDFYHMAIVDVTYAGGQTETYRVSAGNGEKVGDTIEVAYDKRYDTNYEEMLRGQHNKDDAPYLTIARTSKTVNTKNSTVAIAVTFIIGLAAALYLLWCIKTAKEQATI